MITDEFVIFLKNYICVDANKSDAISEITKEIKENYDEWLRNFVQCADMFKWPLIKQKKMKECDIVSESANSNFLKMYNNVTQLMGCADSLVVHHDHFTGHIRADEAV